MYSSLRAGGGGIKVSMMPKRSRMNREATPPWAPDRRSCTFFGPSKRRRLRAGHQRRRWGCSRGARRLGRPRLAHCLASKEIPHQSRHARFTFTSGKLPAVGNGPAGLPERLVIGHEVEGQVAG